MSVELIVSRLLNPEFVCADLPVILALQETSSWDAEYLDLLFMKTFLGSPLSLCLTAFVIHREHGDPRRGARLSSSGLRGS